MQPNIGRGNALIRISCGLSLLAWSTANMVKRPSHPMPFLTATLGSMKVAEGITRFCPATYFVENSATQHANDNEKHRQDQFAINPS